MKIAVASGKGGTGKTTVATNMAYCLCKSGAKTTLLDCDTEEPNAHLFFDLKNIVNQEIGMPIPKLIPEKCNGCSICGDVCRFSAIINIGELTIIHPGMCHGCRACWELCPTGALEPSERTLGKVIHGESEGLFISYGKLDIGELSGNRLIQAVKDNYQLDAINIIDAPPGTSCSVVETLSEIDFLLLVAEPTPFGLANLNSIVELADKINIPTGILINRSTAQEDPLIEAYASRKGIKILGKIPLDRKIAELYSSGKLFAKYLTEYHEFFINLNNKIVSQVEL
ncbi:ATP-binding protein [bacterium]|nr:ATP-binding protein [bacterium]